MCKFTNRLFVFVFLCLLNIEVFIEAAPDRAASKQKRDALENLLDTLSKENNYDLHYDQRQKGEENFRLKLDGFFIGLTAPESSETLLFTEDLLDNLGEELLLGLDNDRTTTSTTPENLLNFNFLSSARKKLSIAAEKPETVIVEIPAPIKEMKARHNKETTASDDKGVAARTTFRIYQLLSLLRRSRKE